MIGNPTTICTPSERCEAQGKSMRERIWQTLNIKANFESFTAMIKDQRTD